MRQMEFVEELRRQHQCYNDVYESDAQDLGNAEEVAQGPPLPLVKTPDAGSGDPFTSLSILLDVAKVNLLNYYMTAWMPGMTEQAPLSTFTPLTEEDFDIANAVVQNSLFDVHGIQIEALLAAAAGRMRLYHGLLPVRGLHPEALAAKATRSFRLYLKTTPRIDEQILPVIYHLAIAEYFNRNMSGTQIHWELIKRFVIQAGGFAKINPSFASFIIASDFGTAVTTLVSPVFDVIQQPEILMRSDPRQLKSNPCQTQRRTAILRQLETRVRTSVVNNIALVETINTLKTSPAHDFARAQVIVQTNVSKIRAVLSTPLRKKRETSPSESRRKHVTVLDAMVTRARILALLIWLLEISLKDDSSLDYTPTTTLLTGYLQELSRILRTAEVMLRDTDWEIDPSLCLWLHSIIAPENAATFALADGGAPKPDLRDWFCGRMFGTDITRRRLDGDDLLASWPPLSLQSARASLNAGRDNFG